MIARAVSLALLLGTTTPGSWADQAAEIDAMFAEAIADSKRSTAEALAEDNSKDEAKRIKQDGESWEKLLEMVAELGDLGLQRAILEYDLITGLSMGMGDLEFLDDADEKREAEADVARAKRRLARLEKVFGEEDVASGEGKPARKVDAELRAIFDERIKETKKWTKEAVEFASPELAKIEELSGEIWQNLLRGVALRGSDALRRQLLEYEYQVDLNSGYTMLEYSEGLLERMRERAVIAKAKSGLQRVEAYFDGKKSTTEENSDGE